MSEVVENKPSESKDNTNLHAFIIGGVAILGAAYLLVVKDIAGLGLLKKEATIPPVVVLDSNRIVDAAIKEIVNSPTMKSDEEIAKIGEKVSGDLGRIMENYAAQGTIVLNKDAAISSPFWLDITDSVAKEIGINVDQSTKAK